MSHEYRYPRYIAHRQKQPDSLAPAPAPAPATADTPTASTPSVQHQTPASRLGGSLPYIQVRTRFALSIIAALAWAGFSTWLALPWIRDLAELITMPLAIFVVGGLAIVPGYLTAYLIATLLLDRPRDLPYPEGPTDWPAVTLMIAAYNEEERIGDALDYALASDYEGLLEIIVIDDGSTDRTREIVGEKAASHPQVSLIAANHGGKARALDQGLETVHTPLVATIDADTLLMPSAFSRLVARFLAAPEGTAAVAGAVLARNSRVNWLSRLQEWDYFLGIGSIKRCQGLWQSTLVAQGAFSVYETDAIKAVRGWPDMIGEDIVLTWALLADKRTVTFEPTAVAFTLVPTHFRHFARQRSRWARGMIEGLQLFGWKLVRQRTMASHGIAINFLFPWIDFTFVVAFIPGLVLACFGNFAIVGPMTLTLLPLDLLLTYLMYRIQGGVFKEMHLQIRRNPLGYLLYIFFYQAILAPLSVVGYAEQAFRRPRAW